jgi:hypothetical protein
VLVKRAEEFERNELKPKKKRQKQIDRWRRFTFKKDDSEKNKNKNNNGNNNFVLTCFEKRERENKDEWLIDSGATVHVTTSDKDMYNKQPTSRCVIVGNGEEIQAKCIGSVTLVRTCGSTICLYNVLFIPDFSMNIMSLTKLLEKGTGIQGSNRQLTLINGEAKLPLHHNPKTGMYDLKTKKR